MTISSSLNAGISGLSANASALASISDNIANSGTFGYKRVQTDFNSMVMASAGGAYSAGGVRSATTRMIDERGSLVATTNATDLAIGGRGMLPVASLTEVTGGAADPTMYMTTTGSFNVNQDGYLVTGSGLVLLGWPANADGSMPSYPRDTAAGLEPIQYDTNRLQASPTTAIELGINLPAESTEAGSAGNVESSLIEHPAVLESAVVGKPDPARGHIVKAFVVLAKDAEPTDALSEELRLHVRTRLGGHAYPREITFLDALPKTPSGKVQRFLLRED